MSACRPAGDLARRFARAVAAGLLCAVVAAGHAAPVGAQPEPDAREVDLSVTELDAVLRPDGVLRLAGRITNGTDALLTNLGLRVTVQRPTTTRLDYQRVLDGPPTRRGTVGSVQVDVNDLAPGASAPVMVEAPAADLGLAGDGHAGVYPLQLSVVSGSAVLDEIRTSAVAVPELLGEPLRTALVVPLDGPVSLSVGDEVEGDPLAGDLAAEGRLPGLAAALADAPELPLTIATSGFVLEAAADAADGYRTRDAAGGVVVDAEAPEAQRARALLDDVRQVLGRAAVDHVALPYATADLVALVRAGQADAAGEAVADGVLSAANTTGTRPAPGVLVPPDGLNHDTLDALRGGLDLVLLRPEHLATLPIGSPTQSPLAVGRLRVPIGTPVTVAVADPWLTPLLAGSPPGGGAEDGAAWPGEEGPAIAAQRVLGETAALYFEAPFATAPRGLVLAPPLEWDPSPEVLTALLAGLADAPWLQPVTLPALVAGVPSAADPLTLAYPDAARARELPPAYLAQVAQARAAAGSLASLLSTGADLVPVERLVNGAASIRYRGRTGEGLELVQAVKQAAQGVFDAIRVVQGPQFTLTDDDGNEVPVELANDGPAAVEVLVRADSPRFAVDPPEQTVVLPPGQRSLVRLSVRALTPGATGPLDFQVTDLSGERLLASGNVVVSARTSSVAAIVLMVGAGTILAVWWFRDARRRRGERVQATPPSRSRVPNPVG